MAGTIVQRKKFAAHACAARGCALGKYNHSRTKEGAWNRTPRTVATVRFEMWLLLTLCLSTAIGKLNETSINHSWTTIMLQLIANDDSTAS